jgi:hypothetical protein
MAKTNATKNKAPINEPVAKSPRSMPIERVAIGKLKPAAYNPRKITSAAKLGLKNAIDRFGMVQPVVWNKRTGNIVGGHQRFEVLREMGEVEIDAVVVDLNEADERALNLSLNNAAIQGDWDDGKLEEMLADMIALPEFDLSLSNDIRLDTILTKFSADDVDLSGFFDDDDSPGEKPSKLEDKGSGGSPAPSPGKTVTLLLNPDQAALFDKYIEILDEVRRSEGLGPVPLEDAVVLALGTFVS